MTNLPRDTLDSPQSQLPHPMIVTCKRCWKQFEFDSHESACPHRVVASSPVPVSKPSSGPTLDSWAYGSPSDVQAFLDAGGDINAPDEKGWSPLHRAAYRDMPDQVKNLLAHGATASEATLDIVRHNKSEHWREIERLLTQERPHSRTSSPRSDPSAHTSRTDAKPKEPTVVAVVRPAPAEAPPDSASESSAIVPGVRAIVCGVALMWLSTRPLLSPLGTAGLVGCGIGLLASLIQLVVVTCRKK